jgi:hypothetical protein
VLTIRHSRGIAIGLLGFGCATMSPQESALRELLWSAATECARTSATLTVTDVDSFGRVHYSLSQGGKQDVPAWEECYQARTRDELAKRPDLLQYARARATPTPTESAAQETPAAPTPSPPPGVFLDKARAEEECVALARSARIAGQSADYDETYQRCMRNMGW